MDHKDSAKYGHLHAGIRSRTHDYGWSKRRVTELDVHSTVLHLDKAPGRNVTIDAFNVAAGGRYETFEVGGQIFNKYAGLEAKMSFVAVEGKAFKASLALGISTEFGIKDHSVGLEYLGFGVKVGEVMGVEFLGSEFSIDFGKIDFAKKVEELKQIEKVAPVGVMNPIFALAWLVT